jgi:hypothetical protein
MLKASGWQEDQPLGKSGQGLLKPLSVSVKRDRGGIGMARRKQNVIVPSTSTGDSRQSIREWERKQERERALRQAMHRYFHENANG